MAYSSSENVSPFKEPHRAREKVAYDVNSLGFSASVPSRNYPLIDLYLRSFDQMTL